MKAEAPVKSLQALLDFKQDENFSLGSLLPRVLIYSSVVMSLALPFYDFKCNCFPQQSFAKKVSEPKQYIASISRAQQAYYAENGIFSESIEKLGLGIKTETNQYRYRIISAMGPVQTANSSRPIAPQFESVYFIAQPKEPYFRSYIGAVFAPKDRRSDYGNTIGGFCQVEASSRSLPATLPTLSNGMVICPPGSVLVDRYNF